MAEQRYRVSLSSGVWLSVNVDNELVPREDIDWLLTFFGEQASKGSMFADGETIQIGWSINLITQRSAEEKGLYEPDFVSMPLVFEDSATTTLQHLRLHRDVVESVGLEPEFPSLRQSAITCTEVVGRENGLLIERDVAVDANDSGLFVGCTESSHDHTIASSLDRSSLYSIVMKCPVVLPYIALPIGTSVRVVRHTPEIFIDGQPARMKSGSFLDRKFGAGAQARPLRPRG